MVVVLNCSARGFSSAEFLSGSVWNHMARGHPLGHDQIGRTGALDFWSCDGQLSHLRCDQTTEPPPPDPICSSRGSRLRRVGSDVY